MAVIHSANTIEEHVPIMAVSAIGYKKQNPAYRYAGSSLDGGGEPPHNDGMELTERVAKIEAKLDATLPNLATKDELKAVGHDIRADMHKEFNMQTWRIIGAFFAIAGLLLAGIKLIH